MIEKIVIKNYRRFRDLELDCRPGLNVIVGPNESGKSTILEAINLALTRKLHGRPIEAELSPFLVNLEATAEYLTALREKSIAKAPEILIELYLADDDSLALLKGTNNSLSLNCPGLRLIARLSDDFTEEYAQHVANTATVHAVPTEFYEIKWYTFANDEGVPRKPRVTSSFIDATTARFHGGTDYYLQDLIRDGLSDKEQAALAMAYRQLKETFTENAAIADINKRIGARRGLASDKSFSVGMDVSRRSQWEATVTPHLADVPFAFIGKGEQHALKILLALDRSVDDAHVVLIEEPENHLSFAMMTALIAEIAEKCEGKQVFASTHSAYVLNKLGIDNVILLHNEKPLTLNALPAGTGDYFRKLPGYDTLRILLAKRSILVEGPSDELIVRKAFAQTKGKPPLAEGVDVISVGGTAFPRFLEIAKALGLTVAVVADNDGDYAKKITQRFAPFSEVSSIRISADTNNDLHTLEPQIVEVNDLALVNKMLGRKFTDKAEATTYMSDHKTECALHIFDATDSIVIPKYIQDAIDHK